MNGRASELRFDFLANWRHTHVKDNNLFYTFWTRIKDPKQRADELPTRATSMETAMLQTTFVCT